MSTAIVTSLVFLIFTSNAVARERLIIIGTASTKGLFYPIGLELCKIINKSYLENGVRCTAITTGGGEYNLMALRTGEIDVALATTYGAYNSYHGQEFFSDYGPDKQLRQVARLYSTPVTFVVASGKFKSLDDLKGRKFNLGNRGGAKRSLAETVLKTIGWSDAELKYVQQFDFTDEDVIEEFCTGNLDGFVMITGIPSPLYDRAIKKCNGELMSFPPETIKKIVAANASMKPTAIPPGEYNRSTEDIKTLAIESNIFVSDRVPRENVALVYSALRDNLKDLRMKFPALNDCSVEPGFMNAKILPIYDALGD
jgi:TRAP transporter TAXI family solute receptor